MRFTRGQRRGSKPGERIEGIRDARPEIRSALERAEKFLSLAALVSVVLAAVAIGLAARRFLQRHLDACAMMRCLGASRRHGRAAVSGSLHRAGHRRERDRLRDRCGRPGAARALARESGRGRVAAARIHARHSWRRDGARAAARIRVAAARLSGARADAARAAPGTRRAAARRRSRRTARDWPRFRRSSCGKPRGCASAPWCWAASPARCARRQR